MTIKEFLKEGYAANELGYINRVLTIVVVALLITGCLMLQGCGWPPKKPDPAVPEGSKTVNIDKDLLKDCAAVPKLEGSTDTQIKAWIEAWAKIYTECATNKRKLNIEVRKAFNIPAQ